MGERPQRWQETLDEERDYGETFGANFRFQTQSGEAPVFRKLWVKENGEWKIISYDIEEP